jgi:hypothetical protein
LKIVPNSLLVAKRFIELLIRMRKAVGRKGWYLWLKPHRIKVTSFRR